MIGDDLIFSFRRSVLWDKYRNAAQNVEMKTWNEISTKTKKILKVARFTRILVELEYW